MLARRLATARPLPQTFHATTSFGSPLSPRIAVRYLSQADVVDPNMNGGYINPAPQKRQFRDPYADWWDKQERRNYGEPVHEDNDILGMFSPDEYTHYKPGKGFFLLGCFVATVFGLCAAVYPYYPDTPSAPRTFPGGLDIELGGEGTLHALSDSGQ